LAEAAMARLVLEGEDDVPDSPDSKTQAHPARTDSLSTERLNRVVEEF
jgi:hypothetical protein